MSDAPTSTDFPVESTGPPADAIRPAPLVGGPYAGEMLDKLDLTPLAAAFRTLLGKVSAYQERATAFGFCVDTVTVMAWQGMALSTLEVEQQFTRLGLDPTQSVLDFGCNMKRLEAVRAARSWLVQARGRDVRSWGKAADVGLWKSTPEPITRMQNLANELQALQAIERLFVSCGLPDASDVLRGHKQESPASPSPSALAPSGGTDSGARRTATPAGGTVCAAVVTATTGATTRSALKQPSQDAFTVYRAQLVTGATQEALANDSNLMEKLRRKVSQGTISRWLTQVKEWIETGNVLPNLTDPLDAKPTPMDPERIDLGANREHRTEGQRKKRNSDRAD